MSYKVFISYSTKDLTIVNHVKKTLSSDEIEVFVAEYSTQPGTDLSRDIQNAIFNCDLFLVIWSENSKTSEWVQQEIGIATAHDKYILPVVLNKSLKLPAFISNLKYLDSSMDIEKALKKIKKIVFPKVKIKQKRQGFVWMAIAAAVLYILSKSDDEYDKY